jgi:dipeptidyl aminopeptidase/acylaminoacyl peptidase
LHEIYQRFGEWPVAYEMPEGFVFGMLHLPAQAGGQVPAVLLCHGFTGHRGENHRLFVSTARALAAAGIAALRIDFRGSGDSWGEFSFMSIETEVADAIAGVRFLRADRRIDPARVGILGLSLGGCVAAITSGRLGDLKATALWAAVAHPVQIFTGRLAPSEVEHALRHVVDHNGWPVGPAFSRSVQEADPLKEIAGAGGPVLVVHGSADPVVPPSEGESYAAALAQAGIEHRHVVIDGADHTFNRLDWTRQVIAETVAWFTAKL